MSKDEQSCCSFPQLEISQQDLPLSCPLPNQRLWDGHPRVYLPIEETGQAICPYCSTRYVLKSNNAE